jgi:hypothetical protein
MRRRHLIDPLTRQNVQLGDNVSKPFELWGEGED